MYRYLYDWLNRISVASSFFSGIRSLNSTIAKIYNLLLNRKAFLKLKTQLQIWRDHTAPIQCESFTFRMVFNFVLVYMTTALILDYGIRKIYLYSLLVIERRIDLYSLTFFGFLGIISVCVLI